MAETYDVFLSYNNLDAEPVRAIAEQLRRQGLKPFLDRWYLKPGQLWVPELERALSACQAVAVFVGSHGLGPWQQREAHAALDRQSRTPDFPLIPVLLPKADPALGFLGQSTWVDLRGDIQDEFGLQLLAAGIRRQPPGPEMEERLQATRAAVCPYRGLLYFREEDAPFFFGREVAIGQLVEAVGQHRFLAAVGASGSGKSSVVRAGLVPALRKDHDTVWEIITLVPGDQPVKSLAAALLPLLEASMTETDRLIEIGKLAAAISQGQVALRDVVRRVLDKQSGTQRLLLVADQWEELYTLTREDSARRRFVDELLDATENSPLTVVATLRGDYVGKALAYRPLSDRLQGAQVNLGPMTRDELRQAMVQPAAKVDLSFESGLVERILEHVGEEPGNLPLLEFVLRQLWDRRTGRLLGNAAYDAIGKLQGAIAQRADEFFNHLSKPEQKVLQQIFLQIVRPSESGEDTRRRTGFSELPEDALDLVAKLASERLVVTAGAADRAGETVEVAHEALIQHWGKLRGWLNEDREFLLWRDRLRGLLREWQHAERNDEALLRGPLLAEAENWLRSRRDRLSKEELEFIILSNGARENRLQKERDQHQRELAQAQALAHEQARRAEESALREASERARAETSAKLAEAQEKRAEEAARREQAERERATAAAALADEQRRRADEAARREEAESARADTARQLAEEATKRAEAEREKAEAAAQREAAQRDQAVAAAKLAEEQRLRADEAGKIAQERQGRIEQQRRAARKLYAVVAILLGVAVALLFVWQESNQKRNLLLSEQGKTKQLQADLETKDREASKEAKRRLAEAQAQADETLRLAKGASDKLISEGQAFKAQAEEEKKQAEQHRKRADAEAAKNETLKKQVGTQMTLAEEERKRADAETKRADNATQRRLANGLAIQAWLHATNRPLSMLLAAQALQVAESAEIRASHACLAVLDLQTAEPGAGTNEVTALATNSSLPDLRSALDLNLAFQKWTPLRTLEGQTSIVSSVAFDPTGRLLAAGGGEHSAGELRIWEVASGRLLHSLGALAGKVESVTFDPTGHALVSGGWDDPAIKFWNATNGQIFRTLKGASGGIYSVAFDPPGRTLASGGIDNTIKLWDPESGQLLRTLQGHSNSIQSVAFDPQGRTLASAAFGPRVMLWDVATGEHLHTIEAATYLVTSVAFDPAGRYLASGGIGTSKLWDAAGSNQLHTLNAAVLILGPATPRRVRAPGLQPCKTALQNSPCL